MGTITEQDEGNGVTMVTEDPKQRACEHGTIGCPYKGEKHACMKYTYGHGQPDERGMPPIELESPTSPASLAARLVDVQGELRDLKNRLFGDEQAMERYAENRRTYVTPNIPKPEPGVITNLQRSFQQYDEAFRKVIELLVKRIEELEKIGEFFGPMLEGKTPPLDGAMIVSRREQDEALARLAGALRDEMSEAKHFVEALDQTFRDAAPSLLRRVGPGMTPNEKKLDRFGRLHWIGDAMLAAYTTTQEWLEARRSPSRLQLAKDAIRSVISGKPSTEER